MESNKQYLLDSLKQERANVKVAVTPPKGQKECFNCNKLLKGTYYQCTKHAVTFCKECMLQEGEKTIDAHSKQRWNDCKRFIFDAMPHEFEICHYMRQGRELTDAMVVYADE